MDPYHYTECGLDTIYLANGVETVETRWGEGTRIRALDALHASIGEAIVCARRGLVAAELRFLRERLELTQAALGRLLGYSDGQRVGAWERGDAEPSPTVEVTLRTLYLQAFRSEGTLDVLALLRELEHASTREPTSLIATEEEGHWSMAPASGLATLEPMAVPERVTA